MSQATPAALPLDKVKGKSYVSRREVLLVSSLARTQRLLRAALQLPQVTVVLNHVVQKREHDALQRVLGVWKAFAARHKAFYASTAVLRDHTGKVTVIQRVIRPYLTNVKHILAPPTGPSDAALVLQRVFRGYLGRGRVILIERQKLLRFLRSWSRGNTTHLYHISDLQEVEAQAMISTAISFTCVPSKPIRDLPSLPQIQSYRAGLFALFWQVHYRRTAKKAERACERSCRQAMHYEDQYAKIRERRDKAKIAGDLQRARELAEQYQRQGEELLKRQEYDTQLLILEMNNKKASALREAKEAQWRAVLMSQEEAEAFQKATLVLLQREWEMMKVEDCRSREHSEFLEAQAEHRIKLEEQAKQVLAVKQVMWAEKSAICRKGYATRYTSAYLTQQLESQHESMYKYWTDFVQTLPLSAAFIQSTLDILTNTKQRFLDDDLHDLLLRCNYGYHAIDEVIRSAAKDTTDSKRVKIFQFFRRASSKAYHPWNECFSLKNLMRSIQSLEINVSLPVKSVVTGEGGGRAKLTCQLSIKLVADSRLLQFEKILLYKYLQDEYHSSSRQIYVDIQQFQASHIQLNNIRKNMKESKQLRSDRQQQLTQCIALEKHLTSLRSELVALALRLYEVVYHLMKMCLELFCKLPAHTISSAGHGSNVQAQLTGQAPSVVANRKGQKGNTGSPLVSKRQRQGQKRLDPTERLFDPHVDDVELFWQQLIFLMSLHGRHCAVSSMEMLTWALPPKPSYQNDGQRHALKQSSSPPPAPVQTTVKRVSKTAKQHAIISYLKKRTAAPKVAVECKYHDIPGCNLYLQPLTQGLPDFFVWGKEMLAWSKSCVDYMLTKEDKWLRGQGQQHDLQVYLARERMHYLYDASSCPVFPANSQAKVADVYELLLCRSDVLVEGSAVTDQGTAGKVEGVLSGEELDLLCGRHPVSLLVRMNMMQQISSGGTPAWPSAFPPRDTLLLSHSNPLCAALASCPSPAGLLRAVDKEAREMEALLEYLIRTHQLVVEVDGDAADGNFKILLQPAASQQIIRNVSTTASWEFIFPLFMYPLYHTGRPSPKEAFYKLLLREQSQGIQGPYSRIDQADRRINIFARRLVVHLQKRVYLKAYFSLIYCDYVMVEQERKHFLYEDTRSYVVGWQEKALQQPKRHWLASMFSCCQPHAKIHIDDKYQQQLQLLKQSSPKALRPTKLPANVKDMLRRIYRANYNFRDTDLMRLIGSMEAFRTIDVAAIQRKLTAISASHAKDHSRTISWTTGEQVYVNAAGKHIDLQMAIFPKLESMSQRYATAEGCAEMILGGGLQGIYTVMRMVEDEQINPRGTAIYEHFTSAEFSEWFASNIPNGQSIGENAGLALRTAFNYHPVCHCCQHAPAEYRLQHDAQFLCSSGACAAGNKVLKQSIPTKGLLQQQLAGMILQRRYGVLSAHQIGKVIKLQAIFRANKARKRVRKIFAVFFGL